MDNDRQYSLHLRTSNQTVELLSLSHSILFPLPSFQEALNNLSIGVLFQPPCPGNTHYWFVAAGIKAELHPHWLNL